MRTLVVGAVALFLTSQASAMDLQTMQLADQLGTMLASEEACGLAFDQDAIERYVEDKVPAADMGFVSMLNTMVTGNKFQLGSMSASTKTAHCAQVRRAARAHGFLGE